MAQAGVETRSKKHATTYLLPVPELLQVVREWDSEVRAVCGNEGLWFAQISDVGEIIPGATQAGEYRGSIAGRDLKNWIRKVGLRYHSAHKFRQGNAVYSTKLARDVGALKAISQNLMHSNLSITDGIYGVLSGVDVKERIAGLDEQRPQRAREGDGVIARFRELLADLENGREL